MAAKVCAAKGTCLRQGDRQILRLEGQAIGGDNHSQNDATAQIKIAATITSRWTTQETVQNAALSSCLWSFPSKRVALTRGGGARALRAHLDDGLCQALVVLLLLLLLQLLLLLLL